MPYAVPTRFLNGVTNSAPWPYSLLGNLSRGMPMAIADDFEDFTKTYTVGDWTIQQTGAGHARWPPRRAERRLAVADNLGRFR